MRSPVSEIHESVIGSFPRNPICDKCIPHKKEATKPNAKEVKKFFLSIAFKDLISIHMPLCIIFAIFYFLNAPVKYITFAFLNHGGVNY
tara:strand:- start:3522 stop:3788 length:267 start_codon:yes stop_codon:yes gene_type:complete